MEPDEPVDGRFEILRFRTLPSFEADETIWIYGLGLPKPKKSKGPVHGGVWFDMARCERYECDYSRAQFQYNLALDKKIMASLLKKLLEVKIPLLPMINYSPSMWFDGTTYELTIGSRFSSPCFSLEWHVEADPQMMPIVMIALEFQSYIRRLVNAMPY